MASVSYLRIRNVSSIGNVLENVLMVGSCGTVCQAWKERKVKIFVAEKFLNWLKDHAVLITWAVKPTGAADINLVAD